MEPPPLRPPVVSTPPVTTRSATVLLAVLLAMLGATLSGCGTEGVATGAEDPAPATSSQSPTESPTAQAPPRVIAYAGGESIGYEVRSPADVAGMQGAPASFKRFIARTVEDLAASSTCEAPSEVIVERLRPDGFATGGVSDCGGYHALWVQVDGRWQEVDGTQEMEGCGVLEEYHVPSELVDGRCYDYDAQRQRAYHQA